MKRILGLALFLALVISPILAQQTSQAASSGVAANEAPATKEDVERLLAALHLREQMQNLVAILQKQSSQMAHDNLKEKFPDVSQKNLDRVNLMMDRLMKSMDLDGMIEDMIPIYQRHLTKEDVTAMLAFYETPTGQKILREQPEMTAEAMKAAQPRMEKMMSEVTVEAEKIAKEIAADSKSSSDGKKDDGEK